MLRLSPLSLRLLFAAFVALFSQIAQAESHYTLEKVVEISRHGVRPPSPDNRRAIEAGSARTWASWLTRDGDLTGHGYTAAWLKGRYESQRYRQLGLIGNACPNNAEFYLYASPMQRTKMTAQALAEAAFPGCGVTVQAKKGPDPLFQYPAGKASKASAAASRQEALAAMGGDLAAAQQRLQPQINALKRAVCQPAAPCPVFSEPWQLSVWSNGTIGIKGLDTLAAMAETLRLEWSENKPLSEVAFGKVRSAAEIAQLMPLLSYKYDYTNDLPSSASRGASTLMDQIAKALRGEQQNALPDTRWLLIVAHDINISWLRTLLDFHWQQGLYPPGNIPPGGSLVFERWRDERQQQFIRIYFQAQSLDQLRQLTPLDQQNPPLLTELHFNGCKTTEAGTLCPFTAAMQRIEKNINRSVIVPDRY
ncbi:histidine-type phosphatase [Pantoea sp. CCBC3-3-1]|uniref:histidine-type phosphatase n=1 Tax=Pantoea sp. CCBC3-3-1 TaxID=2490851 RepID=UPI0011BF6D11|nr:histidine-type phosphatase [Pantoea sp. CCBC3-3-1]